MPNKTIYVSQNDVPIFEQAQQIAGEALSSVIARALREYVARHQEKEKGMKEVSVKVGMKNSDREQRFIASKVGSWKGLSEEKDWWLDATIYRTQKGNWAVYLEHKGPAKLTRQSLLEGDYFNDQRVTELIVANTPEEFKDKLPKVLIEYIKNLGAREKNPVDYLDI